MKKLIAASVLAAGLALGLTACGETDATVGSRNLATAAEQFRIPRHIAGINGITNEMLFEMVGYCSIEDQGQQLEAVCKDENGALRKTIMGKSDNTTYVVRDLEPSQVSVKHILHVFKPETLIPNFTR